MTAARLLAARCLSAEIAATPTPHRRRRRRLRQHLRALARRPSPRTAATWPESPAVDTPVSLPFGPAAERVSFAGPWSALPEDLGEWVP